MATPGFSSARSSADRPNDSWGQHQRNEYANRHNPNHPSYVGPRTNNNFSSTSTQGGNRNQGGNGGNKNQGGNRNPGWNGNGGNKNQGGNRNPGGNGHNNGNRNQGGNGRNNGNRNQNGDGEDGGWLRLGLDFANLAYNVYKEYDKYQRRQENDQRRQYNNQRRYGQQ